MQGTLYTWQKRTVEKLRHKILVFGQLNNVESTRRCIPHACTEEHEEKIVAPNTIIDFFHYSSIKCRFHKGTYDPEEYPYCKE